MSPSAVVTSSNFCRGRALRSIDAERVRAVHERAAVGVDRQHGARGIGDVVAAGVVGSLRRGDRPSGRGRATPGCPSSVIVRTSTVGSNGPGKIAGTAPCVNTRPSPLTSSAGVLTKKNPAGTKPPSYVSLQHDVVGAGRMGDPAPPVGVVPGVVPGVVGFVAAASWSGSPQAARAARTGCQPSRRREMHVDSCQVRRSFWSCGSHDA